MTISSLKKPLSLPLLAFVTIYLMLFHKVKSDDSINFTFNNFDGNNIRQLILQGDATVTGARALQLTRVAANGNPERNSLGRALYYRPFRLWDGSGRVSSFETTFRFVISSPGTPADGLAFFIASPETTIPPGSGGGGLGIFGANRDRVVAVEFDTFSNPDNGDPNFRHIGIDVNNIRSSVLAFWDWTSGQIATVNISYDSSARRLRVSTRYPRAGSDITFSYDINLTTALPQWVRVGFSATTGGNAQINNVLSWNFRSSFQKNYNVAKGGEIASM